MGETLAASSYTAAVRSTIADGELFVYCMAILAPVYWMALADPPGARAFPSRRSHVGLVLLMNAVATIFFTLITAHEKVNKEFAFRGSCTLFAFSLVLLYLAMVYHASRLSDPSQEFKKQEDAFSAAVDEHHQ